MIKLSSTSNTEFSSNTVTGSLGRGLSASSCDGITISNSIFRENTELGILLLNTNDVTISGNEVRDSRPNGQDEGGLGIFVNNSERVSVSTNIVEDNTDAGILVYYATSATISGNEVRDTKLNGEGVHGNGIVIMDSEQVSVSGNILEDNADSSVFFSTASGTIDGNVICNTLPDEECTFGRGINVQESEGVSVSDNLIEGTTDTGIYFSQSGGTISGNEVRDTISNGQGEFGFGIYVLESEQVSVSDNIVEDNSDAGIFFSYSSGTISGNEVCDTKPSGQGMSGRGINVQDSEQVSVSYNVVDGNHEGGIAFNKSIGAISGNEVRDTRPNVQGMFGRGIIVQESGQVSVSDNIVEGNAEIGIFFGVASGTISGNQVRDTMPGAPDQNGYTYGHGIHVQDSSDVECSSNIVEDNVHAGIFYILTANGDILDNQVSGTLAESRDTSDRGDGIIVLGIEGFITIQDNTLDSNDRCGVLADSSTGMIERNGIFGNENSIVAQNGSDMNVSDNDIHDNDLNEVQFFEGRELPVNDSMIERNGML